MRRIRIWIPILIVTALTHNMAFATLRVISATGTDSGNCAAPNSCDTFAYAASFTVGGDTIGWIPSATMYTATGNAGSFPSGIDENTFPPHTSNYIWLMGLGDPNVADGWGDIRFPTSCVIFNGGSTQFGVDKSSYIVWKNFYGIDGDGALVAADSNHVKFIKIGLKNPTPHSSDYTAGVSFISAGDGGQEWSTTDSLLEEVWVIGEARNSVIIGGTSGFAEKNILRRVVVRWDGNDGSQPAAGISIYGDAGFSPAGGARRVWLQNSMVIDSNDYTFKSGENLYGMIYFPHNAEDVTCNGCIIYANAGGYGTIPGEDSATRNAFYNSLIFGQTGPGVFTNYNGISSTTFRGNTIGETTDSGYNLKQASGYTFENNLIYRTGGSNSTAATDDYNGFYPSTAANSGTHRNTNDPSLVIGSSVNPNATHFGGGKNGANIGCTIDYQVGKSGTLYGETGWNDVQSTPVFPWPYEAQLQALMAKQDTGSAAANNSSNNEGRGWAGQSGTALKDYTINGVKLGFAAGAAEDEGGGGDPEPSGTPYNFKFEGSSQMRGSFNIR